MFNRLLDGSEQPFSVTTVPRTRTRRCRVILAQPLNPRPNRANVKRGAVPLALVNAPSLFGTTLGGQRSLTMLGGQVKAEKRQGNYLDPKRPHKLCLTNQRSHAGWGRRKSDRATPRSRGIKLAAIANASAGSGRTISSCSGGFPLPRFVGSRCFPSSWPNNLADCLASPHRLALRPILTGLSLEFDAAMAIGRRALSQLTLAGGPL